MPDYLFVTGALAADSLELTLGKMRSETMFVHESLVLNISVAALMNTRWIAERLPRDHGCEQVMIPGACRGDLSVIEERVGVPVIRGPKDLKDLPLFFGRERVLEGYGESRVKILAEIVDAYQMSLDDIMHMADYYAASGADIIDLGCPPEGDFPGVAEVVTALKERGYEVSVDTFDPATILSADAAGVDLLLSVNNQNLPLARKLHCKVVVIPDFGEGLASLEKNAAQLDRWGVPYVMDPILDPINFGFVEALQRFHQARRRHPKAEMLMGLGNVTELTDADSTGINALMTGIVTELDIDYVLTTEVISWARGSVRELDLARKLMHYAHHNRILPKNLDDRLVTLKDPPHGCYSEMELRRMQHQVGDRNFRIFTDRTRVYVFNRDVFIEGVDPKRIFEQLDVRESSQAFYLGRELERAALAVQLGKKYIQESPLRWGYLSEEPVNRAL